MAECTVGRHSSRPIAAARHDQLVLVARVGVQKIASGRRARVAVADRRPAAAAAAAVVHRLVRAVAVHGCVAQRTSKSAGRTARTEHQRRTAHCGGFQ